MIISPEGEEREVLGEGPSNPHPEAAVTSLLILGKLVWGGLCTRQGEKEVSWRCWRARWVHKVWRREAGE